MGKVGSEVACVSLHSSDCTSSLGSTGGGSTGILTYQLMPALLHFRKYTILGNLGFESFQPPLDIPGEICISSFSFSSSGSIQVHGRTCQWSVQTSYSGGTLLAEGSLASHHSQHVVKHSLSASYHKRPHHGCFSQPGVQGLSGTDGVGLSVCNKNVQAVLKVWVGWCV